MQNNPISFSRSAGPVKDRVQEVATQLLRSDTAGQGSEPANAVLDTFFEQDALHTARIFVGELAAFPANRLMLAEPNIAILCEKLSARAPCLKSALQWPQVQSFGSLLISNEIDLREQGLSDDEEGEFEQRDALSNCEREACKLLPAEWLRLNAGLTVAENISGSASDLVSSSKFFAQVDSLGEFSGFSYDVKFVTENGKALSARLQASDRSRAERIESLLRHLYPSFAEEIEALNRYGVKDWKLGIAYQLCKYFDESTVVEATKMFDTEGGRELWNKFPQAMRALDALSKSDAFVSLAEKAVQAWFDTIETGHAGDNDNKSIAQSNEMDLQQVA